MRTATKPRELPMLFHARSIEGIQAGRKTVTRRIVKPQPTWNGARWVWPIPKRAQRPGCATECVSASREWHAYMPPGCCPYGAPGDLLWVRETWSVHRAFDADKPSDLTGTEQVRYLAAGERWELAKLRPSIFLPKWAARIWLRVTDVRVERVQEITTADIWAEGVQIPTSENGSPLLRLAKPGPTEPAASFLPKGRLFGFPNHEPLTADEIARIYFAELWDETNGAGAWERNDWVWVISFEPAEAPRGS